MDLIYRYVCGHNSGILAKVAQLTGTPDHPVSLPPPSSCTPPGWLRERLPDIGEKPSHYGSVAHIYTGTHAGRTVACKMVHRDTAATIERDIATLTGSAQLLLGFNTTVRDAVVDVGSSIRREVSMAYERRMASKVRQAVRTPYYQALSIDVPDPVRELCTATSYAYEYVEGSRLGRAHANRLVLGFFRLMHGDGILLGDPNIGNFLGDDDGTIWVIDFGSAAMLSHESREKLRRVHEAGYDTARLAHALPGIPMPAVEATAKMTRAFWDAATPIQSPTVLYECVSSLASAQLDPNLVLAFRAIVILLCNLQEMGVTHLSCADELPGVVSRSTQSTGQTGAP